MKWLERFRRPAKESQPVTHEDIKDVGTLFIGGRTWVKAELLTGFIIPAILAQVMEDPQIDAGAALVALLEIIEGLDSGTFDVVFENQINSEE